MTSKALASRKSRLNIQIVREKDQKKMYELLILFILLVLISIPVLLYLRNRIEYVKYQYEITELKHRKKVLLKNEMYLETEKAFLESPCLLEKLAGENLSLKSQNEGGCVVVVRVQEGIKDRNSLLTDKKPEPGFEEMLVLNTRK